MKTTGDSTLLRTGLPGATVTIMAASTLFSLMLSSGCVPSLETGITSSGQEWPGGRERTGPEQGVRGDGDAGADSGIPSQATRGATEAFSQRRLLLGSGPRVVECSSPPSLHPACEKLPTPGKGLTADRWSQADGLLGNTEQRRPPGSGVVLAEATASSSHCC